MRLSLTRLPKFAIEPETSDVSFQVDEAEHFCRYTQCGAWVDRRDLGPVFDHSIAGNGRAALLREKGDARHRIQSPPAAPFGPRVKEGAGAFRSSEF